MVAAILAYVRARPGATRRDVESQFAAETDHGLDGPRRGSDAWMRIQGRSSRVRYALQHLKRTGTLRQYGKAGRYVCRYLPGAVEPVARTVAAAKQRDPGGVALHHGEVDVLPPGYSER